MRTYLLLILMFGVPLWYTIRPAEGECNQDQVIRAGWGNFVDIKMYNEPGRTRYRAKVECLGADREFSPSFSRVIVPITTCPTTDEPDRAAALATVQTLCHPEMLLHHLAPNVVTLPDGSPLMIRASDILASIDLDLTGTFVTVSDRHAVRDVFDMTEPAGDAPWSTFVVWRERSPTGGLIFDPVHMAVRNRAAPLTAVHTANPATIVSTRILPDSASIVIMSRFGDRSSWSPLVVTLERAADQVATLPSHLFVLRPDGTPLIVSEEHILDSIVVGRNGTLGVSGQFGVAPGAVGAGQLAESMNHFVVWRNQTPEGEAMFDPVFLAARRGSTPPALGGDRRRLLTVRSTRVVTNPTAVLSMTRLGEGDRLAPRFVSVQLLRHQPDEPLDPCAICLLEVCHGADQAPTGCGHSFHGSCLSTWLALPAAQGRCPMCRAPVVLL